MAFTLVDLKAQIAACPAGGAIGVPYELYSELFQPGEPDEGAREHAYKFAKANGCAINNKWTGEIVFFVKPKPATA
jgi:hypothetical protein